MRFENERSGHPEQKIEEEQKIGNGLITFKISHVIVLKWSGLRERKA